MSGRIDVRYQLIFLDEVASTQSYLLENLTKLEVNTLVVCHRQTAGYGRQHSKWLDSSKNLAFSFAFKYAMDPARSFQLAVYLAKALNSTLAQHGLDPQIKWPNDIYLEAKMAGMLIDYRDGHVVVGIGINLNENFGTFAKTDWNVDKIQLAQEIATAILNGFDEDFEAVLAYCNDHSYLANKTWTVKGLGEIEVTYLDKSGNLHYNKDGKAHTMNVTQFSLKS